MTTIPRATKPNETPAAVADRRDAAIVGAGLAGLTAAYRLKQQGWRVTVFEADTVVGGRVRTEKHHGYLLDTGATALAESYHSYLSLVEELGIRGEIVPSSPYVGIYRDGRIHHLRLDRAALSGLRTRLLSTRAKLRSFRLGFDVGRAKLRGRLDYSEMRKAAPLDVESARDYARRALGDELAEYLCEPVTRMMLIADAGDISVVELFSGLANIFSSKICSLRGGQGRLPELLASALDVRLDCPVDLVADSGDYIAVTPRGAREPERFDACVISVPLFEAARVCPDRAAILGPLNDALDYTQCLSVAVGTTVPPESPALVIELPPSEDAAVALMFLNHNKSTDRAPDGRGLIECCWEARASEDAFAAPDYVVAKRTIESVVRVFPELRGRVEFTHVTRWQAALPRTRIGSYKLIGEFNARIDAQSRIQFAADYMSAAGQNTAVEFGNRAANALTRAFAPASS